jgi:hypothetical protein
MRRQNLFATCLAFGLCAHAIIGQATQQAQAAASAQKIAFDNAPVSNVAQTELEQKIEKECVTESAGQPASYYCVYLAQLLANVKPVEGQPVDELDKLNNDPIAMLRAATADAGQANVKQVMEEVERVLVPQAPSVQNGRIDKQLGSSAASSGSTSLVSMPGATQLLSAAIDSGVLTEGQSGNTVTVSANADQLGRYIFTKSKSTIEYSLAGTPVLQNLNLSVSLLTNQSGSSTVSGTTSATSATVPSTPLSIAGSATKFSGLTARYEFRNKFNPKDPSFQKNYMAEVAKNASETDLAAATGGVSDDITRTQDCKLSDQTSLVSYWGGGEAKLARLIRDFNSHFKTCITAVEKDSTFESHIVSLQTAVSANVKQYLTNVANARGPAPVTFEYVYNKPVNQPDTHDFRLIGSQNLGAGLWTLNAAGSIYATVPNGAKYGRFKSFQASAEFDRKFPPSGTNATTLTIAGYGQWQPNPSVLNVTSSDVPSGITLPSGAQTYLTDTSGWLGVAQVKFTFHISGAQIPISAKWSNQKNLLDSNKQWGGQFGLSYDLTTLKQLFSGGS